MNEEGAFIYAIREKPEDESRRLVYADWLDEHGHPERAEFFRLEHQLRHAPSPLPEHQARLQKVRDGLDETWLNSVTKLWSVVLLTVKPENEAELTLSIRFATNFSLTECEALVQKRNCIIKDELTIAEAEALRDRLQAVAEVGVQRDPKADGRYVWKRNKSIRLY